MAAFLFQAIWNGSKVACRPQNRGQKNLSRSVPVQQVQRYNQPTQSKEARNLGFNSLPCSSTSL